MHPLGQLDPSKVLVVEAAAAEALDLKQSVHALGCTGAGPGRLDDEALRLLRKGQPRLAVLDTVLRDGSACGSPASSSAQSVPFALFASSDALWPTRYCAVHRCWRNRTRRSNYRCPCASSMSTGLAHSVNRINERIIHAWGNIEAQVRIINRLALAGHDTGLAEQLLQTYEHTVAILHEQRDRMARELDCRDEEERAAVLGQMVDRQDTPRQPGREVNRHERPVKPWALGQRQPQPDDGSIGTSNRPAASRAVRRRRPNGPYRGQLARAPTPTGSSAACPWSGIYSLTGPHAGVEGHSVLQPSRPRWKPTPPPHPRCPSPVPRRLRSRSGPCGSVGCSSCCGSRRGSRWSMWRHCSGGPSTRCGGGPRRCRCIAWSTGCAR